MSRNAIKPHDDEGTSPVSLSFWVVDAFLYLVSPASHSNGLQDGLLELLVLNLLASIVGRGLAVQRQEVAEVELR